MECPACHRENEATNRFCIYCGRALQMSPSQPSSEGEIPGMDKAYPLLNSLRDEMFQLKQGQQQIRERLAALERLQGIATPAQPPLQTAPVSRLEAVPATAGVPITAPVTVTVPPIAEQPPSPPKKPREWEQILGGNWLARIGIVALIIGAAFFLKFAFDQNWLGPTARVILGVVAGAALVGIGYFWRNRYPTFSQALSGGGIALFYLSFFSAFAIFSLIPLYPAVGLLLLVSIGSAVLATRYNSMALAIIGIVGAFAAPFIIGIAAPGGIRLTPGDRGIQLIVYVLIVDGGVLVLSTFRNWRWFTLLALFGSLLAFAGWQGKYGHNAGLFTSQLFITIAFLLFFGATSLFHIIWRKPARGFDYALMSINAAAYLLISYGIMWHDLRGWMGGFTILLALFYGGLAYAAFRRSAENTSISVFYLAVAIVLVTIAIPVQLGDKVWTTIAWAVELVALVWLSFALRMPLLRSYGYGIFVIMAGRLLIFETPVDIRSFQPILNQRFLAFAVGIAASYFAAYLLWRYRQTMPEWKAPASTFLIAANFFSLWVLSFEVWNSFSRQLVTTGIVSGAHSLRNAQNLSLTALWAIYAMVLLVIGIVKRWRAVRLAALGLLAVPIIKVFVYDVFALEQVYRIIAFVGLGLLLLSGAYLYQRHSKAIRGFLTNK